MDGRGHRHTKIEEARDAASLFVELIRVGAGDRIGMLSFSTTASSPVDFGLHPVDAGAKNTLIGPSPFAGGIVGGITPNGLTSIGDGLEKAAGQFPPWLGVNQRTVLLMTDGLQNTPPMTADASPFLAGTDLSVVGLARFPAWTRCSSTTWPRPTAGCTPAPAARSSSRNSLP